MSIRMPQLSTLLVAIMTTAVGAHAAPSDASERAPPLFNPTSEARIIVLAVLCADYLGLMGAALCRDPRTDSEYQLDEGDPATRVSEGAALCSRMQLLVGACGIGAMLAAFVGACWRLRAGRDPWWIGVEAVTMALLDTVTAALALHAATNWPHTEGRATSAPVVGAITAAATGAQVLRLLAATSHRGDAATLIAVSRIIHFCFVLVPPSIASAVTLSALPKAADEERRGSKALRVHARAFAWRYLVYAYAACVAAPLMVSLTNPNAHAWLAPAIVEGARVVFLGFCCRHLHAALLLLAVPAATEMTAVDVPTAAPGVGGDVADELLSRAAQPVSA